MASATATGRRGPPPERATSRPLRELLGAAGAGRAWRPDVACARGAMVLRRGDGGPVPATGGPLAASAARRERHRGAEAAPHVFRGTAAGRPVPPAGQG